MSELIAGDFNYASVDEETATKLEYFAKSGKALIRKSQIQFIADMGQILSEARDLLANHKSGTFAKWAEAEFDIGKQTIYNYVNAWDRILSKGWTIYSNWTQTALYLASSDDFPTPVMKKLEKIPATDLVRTSDVKRLVEANKPKPEPEPESNSDDDVPFDAVPSLTPAQKKKADAEAARKKKKAYAESAAQAKKEKAAADRAAKKLADAAAKEQKKKDAKAAKDKERQEAAAAKLKALPKDEQISFIKSQIQQHLGKMVRLLDELNGVKPNRSALNANLKACEGIKLW